MSSVIILLTLSVNSKHDKAKLVISPVSCTANLPVGLQVKSSDGYTTEDFIASSCSCSTCSISNATTTLVRLTGPIAPIILITCLYALMYLIQHSFNQLPTPRGHSLKISKPYCKTVMRKFFFHTKSSTDGTVYQRRLSRLTLWHYPTLAPPGGLTLHVEKLLNSSFRINLLCLKDLAPFLQIYPTKEPSLNR